MNDNDYRIMLLAYRQHVPAEPTHENGWASWWCTTCGHHCASDNLCDHCQADFDEWAATP